MKDSTGMIKEHGDQATTDQADAVTILCLEYVTVLPLFLIS